MAYSTYHTPPARSGIAYFGENPGAQTFESNANFRIDAGNSRLLTPNLLISDGGTIGSTSKTDAITIGANGDLQLVRNLSVAGDLIVNGTTTTVNSTTVTIHDPIIVIGSGAPTTDDNKDRGIVFNWHTGSVARSGFFGFDDSTGKFTFIPDATIASEVVSGTAGTIVANIEGNVSGTITGNATTATTLATARNFSMTGEMTAGAVSFNGSADVVLTGVLHQSAVSGQPTITSIDAVNDFILVWDATTGDLAKINRTNFVTGLGAMSSFILSDGTNTQTVEDGETLRFLAGTAINFTVSATNSVSGTLNAAVAGNGLSMTNQVLAVDFNEFSAVGIASGDSFAMLDSDAATEQRTTITVLGNYLAGNGLVTSGDGVLSVNAGAGLEISSDSLRIAAAAAGNGLTGGAGSALAVGAGNGITVSADAVAVTDGSGIIVTGGGVHANLISYATQSVAANAATSTASRTYPIQVNGSDQLVVNVPWTDTGMTFTISDGTNTQSIANGDTLRFQAGAAINFTVSATDTVSGTLNAAVAGNGLSMSNQILAVDFSEFSAVAVASGDSFATLDSDGTTEQRTSVSNLGSYFAGDGLIANGSGVMSINVDNSTVEINADTLRVKDAGITKAKRSLTFADVVSGATVADTTDVVIMDATSANATATLPASPANGSIITFKRIDASTSFNCTIVRDGAQTIDGATQIQLYYQWESVTLVYRQSSNTWYII